MSNSRTRTDDVTQLAAVTSSAAPRLCEQSSNGSSVSFFVSAEPYIDVGDK